MSNWNSIWLEHGMSLPWIVDIPETNLCEFLSTFGKKKNILDIGCGHGYHTNVIKSYDHYVTGLDISKTAIELARQFYPNINFLVDDILSYEDNTKYDLVYDKGCFHHIKTMSDKNEYFKKVRDLLSSNGYWLCLAGKIYEQEEDYRIPQLRLSQYINYIEPYLDIIQIKQTFVNAINGIKLPAWKILAKKYDK